MVSMREIQALGREIGREFRPRRVILFGSHARGTATVDSDVDLFVIMPFTGRSVDNSVEILLKSRPHFAMDILVRSPSTMRERAAMGDPFTKEILAHGKVLYENDRR